TIDPQGCVFDKKDRMFANDVGTGAAGANNGSLLVFFPGKDRRYTTFCFLDKALAAPGMPAMDDDGNLYVPEPASARLTKFSPPFPSSAADCDNPEHLVTTPPVKSGFFTGDRGGLVIPVSIVRAPGMRTCGRRGVVLALLLGLAPAAAARDWPTYAGGPRRLFFNPARTPITPANVHGLHVKWTFPTGAIVTASPSVAEVKVPGEGRVQVAFLQSRDHTLYALRTPAGSA